MKLIIIVFTIMTLLANINTTYTFQDDRNFNDTSYVKSLTYARLNNFVSYHIIKNGSNANKSDAVYRIRPIAAYYYYNHRYERDKKDTQFYGKSTDVTKLLLSNMFSNRVGFDGIFKINSKVMLVYKPWTLKKMIIRPRSTDTSSWHVLINKLKKENFVSEASLTTNDFQWIGGIRKNLFITILLKSAYQNIESEKQIKNELKRWSEIEDVSSPVDLFTGISEYETIFRITSKEK